MPNFGIDAARFIVENPSRWRAVSKSLLGRSPPPVRASPASTLTLGLGGKDWILESRRRFPFKSVYLEKLRDPRWQKRRLEIMNRDHFSCQNCCDTKQTLNVHHQSYERGKDPWDYPDCYLITLCDDCHEIESRLRRETEDKLLKSIRLAGFLVGDLEDLANALSYHHNGLRFYEVEVSVLTWILMQPDVMRQLTEQYFEFLEAKRNAGELEGCMNVPQPTK